MIIYCIFVFIFGLAVGSFLNVCIYRIPEGKRILTPASHCPTCGEKLKLPDLVPVLSYLLLKRSCRYCHAKISLRYPFVEIITAITFVLLFYRYQTIIDFIPFAFLMSILIAVFFIDLDHKVIPDGLVVAGLAGCIPVIIYNIFNPMLIYGDTHWYNPLLGVLPGSGLLLFIAVIGFVVYKSDDAMGMGDVKIFAPIGIFLGWRMCALALLISILLGGLSGLFLIISNIKKKRDTIPFGPFIVLGTLIVIMWGWDILNWYINRVGF